MAESDIRIVVTLARTLVALLIIFSGVFPAVMQVEKTVVFGAALGLIAILVLKESVDWTGRQRVMLTAALFYSCIGAIWVIYGELSGNPGAPSMAYVYVVYPGLLTFVGVLVRRGDLDRIRQLLVFMAILVLLVELLFMASFFGADGAKFYGWAQNLYQDTAAVDVNEKSLVFALPNVSTLMFLGPFMLLQFVLGKKARLGYLLLGGLSVMLLLLAGRRAAYPAVACGVLAALIASRVCRGFVGDGSFAFRRVAAVLACVGVVVAGLFASGVMDFQDTVDQVISMVNFSTDDSNLERRLQFEAMMEGIGNHPLIGLGAGAVASYVRSQTQPWAYELSYVSLLFNFGIIGATIYVAGVLYLLIAMVGCARNIRLTMGQRATALCFFGGMIAFIVANATNPYLSKFDYMWVLFIPVAIAAAGLNKRGVSYSKLGLMQHKDADLVG